MIYIGIDFHKSFSLVTGVDERGNVLGVKKVRNTEEEIRDAIKGFGDTPKKAVIEAWRNWGLMYDLLEESTLLEEIIVSNPYKTRLIAEAKIKTDKIDSHILAELLRTNFICKIQVPPKDIRLKKEVIRYRTFLVVMKTRIKNRIHNIIDRNHLSVPDVSDIFGKYGMEYLKGVSLPESERKLLDKHIEILEFLNGEIKEKDEWINDIFKDNEDIKLLMSIPGIGKVFAPLIFVEIWDINRFSGYEKLWSYSGLVPRTYSSGNRIYHGRLLNSCNKWLRWAFIEAGVSAIAKSPYFRRHYLMVETRKGSQAGIISVGRKVAKITYFVLKEKREYKEIKNPDSLRKMLASKGSGQG